MSATDAWSLSGAGPETYEDIQVPSIFEPLARMLLARVGLRPGERVLDVACGTGVVARLAAAEIGPAGHVVGIDFNQAMLDVAAKTAPSDGAPIDWRQGDAGQLPADDGAFDVVLCQQGLQFFPEKVAALAEMRRALAPDGRLWLAVWRAPEHVPVNMVSNEVLGRHLGPDVARVSRAPFALGEADELRALAEQAGFRDIEIEAAVLTRNMLPPEISIPGQLTSLPFGPKVAALDAATRETIVREIAEGLADYRTADGMTVPQGTHLVSARA